jgi:hypothetical protein
MHSKKLSNVNLIAISERIVSFKVYRLLLQYRGILWAFLVFAFLSVPTALFAQTLPPQPSKTSTVGQTVTNPLTGLTTTVSALLTDPTGTPTAGTTAFVETADGYAFLVKTVGEKIYNSDPTPLGFTIVSQDIATKTVQLDADPLDGNTAPLSYQLTTAELQAQLFTSGSAGVVTAPVVVTGATGVQIIKTGQGGSNGRDGAVFVPPTSGGNGDPGPSVSYTNNINISTNNQIGIEVGSVGGKGGQGGDSYLSFWNGEDGGDGGAGGDVTVTNETGYQVATTGTDKYGIFAYSRSGQAGNGGSGFAAPGGGTGGHSSDGGNVTITNKGNIITTGEGAFGIYGLSVSNNGGNGGSQWGLVGQSGSGGFGGSGGTVSITNTSTGTINTSGNLAHGIVAQSIGGSGGSSGTSGNLIVSLLGSPDNGGNGGQVSVTNNGAITTAGDNARGIFAQSIGGGGGSGGFAGGLIAVGGAGSGGGSGNTVTVINNSSGSIATAGSKSDGIFAQSVGGSGGSGSNAGGLVAVGGSGSKAGDGGVVTVENYGSISTQQDGARGVVAQSIGGGGGDGGNSGGFVAVGGSGDGGGTSSTVTIRQGGSITTAGSDSIGILAQSIGGGGGNGGSAGSVGAFVGVAVGGTGGAGGNGGTVSVTLQGKDANTASVIRTVGDRSTGLFAQSVGGGGGNGGGAVQVTGGFVGAASFAVGGQGGQGGQGGGVTLAKGTGLSIVETTGDDATGVMLQSVGGGGGNGGYAVSVAASGGPVSGSLSVAIGGTGGTAGTGGQVTLGSFDSTGALLNTGFNGSILTTGERSTGFFAQSVGGGGGNGGLAVSASGGGSLFFSGSIGIGVGGSGSGGGDGGTVSVGTQGNITTENTSSIGLLVQSVGGGGGNGGGSISASLDGSGGGAGSIGVAIGGSAATGSKGGQVTAATRSGTVTTSGDHSAGIVVQSIGGGGGTGGYSISAGAAGAAVGAGAINVSLGGNGGGGGDGGTVKAELQSNVNTSGQNAAGILVQSVGGGGGNGGYTVSAGIGGAGVGSGAVSVGLGGQGATGGIGGTVNAASTGTIMTQGDRSAGFVAQSIGGGGGNGGFNISADIAGAGTGSGTVSVGLGGEGGAGNHGGEVTASTSIGSVTTKGNESIGILAQSVGGGGGNGGFNVSGGIAGAGTGSGAVSVGLGGSGGSAGNGSKVTLTVQNEVTTSGKNSTSVVAQSIGGGGGNGGFNVSGSGAGAGVGGAAISIGLGGSGSGGGNADAVVAETQRKIATTGDGSGGILAQSVGGGGGNGGFNISAALFGAGTGSGAIGVGLGGSGAGGGIGSTVNLTVTNDVTTSGKNASGIVAQSVGGGGGNGGFDVSATFSGAGTASGAIGVGLGGSAGTGGTASAVTSKVTGNIVTGGENSTGLLVQSVGGGGGNGGFNVSAALSGAGTGSVSAAVGIGGSGGSGGDSIGKVTSSLTGNVTTAGTDSTGVIVQSLGGGGGNGGLTIAGAISGAQTGSAAASFSVGGSGGDGGNSSEVDSTVVGDVSTTNDGSGGVLAQSLGGGGGNGGISVSGAISLASTGSGAVSVGVGGSGGNGGTSAKVTSKVTGTVNTTGTNGLGVAAQAIGGGGGNGGINVTGDISAAKTASGAISIGIGGVGGGGGDAADVDNTVTGYVQTTGTDATGILAQSLGGGGGNGGLNVTGAITGAQSGSGNIAVGVGGFGGDGGDGKNVVNTVTGGTVTTGDDANGIVAQSLGGGGGNGALNVTGSINLTKDNGGTVGIGVGGFGGVGGNAGNVTSTVTTTADHNKIRTTGDNSSAVVAQSIGGGGGNGGTNVTGAVNLTGKNGAAIGVGVGGFGGGAGDAGDVTLGVTGQIETTGNNSHGLLAQSIGGGGGNGGTNVTGSLAFTNSIGGSATTVAASIGVGGFGGNAGNAGAVNVTYSGTIVANPTESGTGSHGIAAQSIGGGGGNGGLNVSSGISYARGSGDAYGILVGVGGFGGSGGDAGSVNVTVNGGESISSSGSGHSAILAQSVGGGGGNGGTNVSGGIVSDSPLVVGVGGFGADAGIAKNVTVNATTDVVTSGSSSEKLSAAGILAQSLGGGGGNGGLNVSGGIAISKESTVPSITVGIGGYGGAGAISGNVTVNQVGDVTSTGDWTHGIMAQSIAGGGGNGGLNVSGELNFADSTNSSGKTDLSIVAGIGGNAGKGADAGNVLVTHDGVVTTQGDNARGVAAQSIGGGGGTGGMNVTGVFAKSSSPVTVGVGGSGTGGGNAGSATITRGTASLATGKVTTDGEGAHAIEASSIGGGGGDAGMNFIAGVSLAGKDNTAAGFTAQFAIGGAGGEAGNGGAAKVTNYSDIVTNQDNSYGIMSQSIGGGGGNANLNLAVTYEGKSEKNMGFNLAIGGGPGNAGDGGRSDVFQAGNIETFGDSSFGILSQSIGGGGGNVGFDTAYSQTSGGTFGITIGRQGGIGGSGSDVTLSSNGNVTTHGDSSFGLLAQSLGNSGGNSSVTSVSFDAPQESADKPAESFSVSVGLEGGTGGKAGMVTLDAKGSVSTIGDKSHAIFAQSVGGGGGNGGAANTQSLIGNAPTAALSIGGTGGTGGIGGVVKVTSSADVTTQGESSVGILAQSIGGGGGTGGMARSGGLKAATSGATVSVGGSGGSGMTSSSVTVDNSGIIITNGEGSHGVLAQSLGGGGGNAGMTINTLLQETTDTAKRLALSIGGTGGDGAVSGDVTVTNTGGIGTDSEKAVGIFAQSIGGGGGNSDNVITGSLAGKGGGNSFFMGIGGSGGTGGAAGNVTVSNLKDASDNSGKIITVGNYSHGILAMSVGGGGGTGSNTTTIKKSAGSSETATANSINFSLGGAGGTGGTGGTVNVTNSGEITTYGYKAHGILAESVGGGGGNGGMSITGDLALGSKTSQTSTGQAGIFSVGGSGGDGNKAGDVTVKNTGSIEVFGDESYGIYAQSVGGGGGDGGMAMSLSRNLLTNPKTNLKSALSNIAVGGNGGSGGDSGNVLVQHDGAITSHGDNSYGIFAQSVSGGGGNVGYSITNPAWMATDFAISTLLGGRDGAKGTAGTVTINTSGNINMLGKNSTAQLGQSVNGGGGNVDLFLDFSQQAEELGDDGLPLPDNGGIIEKATALASSVIELGGNAIKSGVASAIDATHVGNLYTSAKNSLGSLVQSIGGGGGNATSEVVVDSNAQVDLTLALGAKDTDDSNGGDITSNRVGDVYTSGNWSQGTSIQSIGGGGGRLLLDAETVSADNNQVSGSSNSTATVTLGADPSFNNNGGAINSNLTGDIVTSGNYSPGLVLQSIGAGGGQTYLSGLKSATIDLGASDGSTGNGGDIQVSNTGAIITSGKLADGIVLQSIGGGGGYVITDLAPSAIALNLSSNNAGNGGNIQLTQTGDIAVQGERSIGILAQSLGGGGGVVDRLFMDTAGGSGSSGAITLALNGNVQALGEGSVGVFAQSRSTSAPGNIAIELAAGKQINVSDKGVAVQISGGAKNQFVNNGSVVAASGSGLPDGYAFRGDSGDETIVNQPGATFFGNINLGGGSDSVVNEKGASAFTGHEVFVGNGSTESFVNRGLISPGGSSIYTTQITGNYAQAATGQFDLDLDFTDDSLDRLNITQQASLDGVLKLSPRGITLIKPGQRNLVFAAADGGITRQDLELNAPKSAIVAYSIKSTNQLAFLDTNVDFAGFGKLNPNQTSIGKYLNNVQSAGSSIQLSSLIEALYNLSSTSQLKDAYNRLSPEIYGSIQSNLQLASQRFLNNLFTCRNREGNNRFIAEGQCVWFETSTQGYNSDRTTNHFGFESSNSDLSAGIQFDLGQDWFLGASVGHSTYQTDFSGATAAQISGFTREGGVAIKKIFGSTKVGLGFVGGYSEFDSERHNVFPFNTTASATQSASFFGSRLRISHDLGGTQWYIRPMLDFGLSRVKHQGFHENGAGALNLVVSEGSNTYATFSPAIEVGGEIKSGQLRILPRASIGYMHYLSNPSPSVSARLEGAPSSVSSFEVSSLGDRDSLDTSANIDFLFQNGIDVSLGYWGQYSQHTSSNGGYLKMSLSF